MSRVDRSHWKVVKKKMSEDDGIDEDVLAMTPGERLGLMTALMRNVTNPDDRAIARSRLQRDVVRVIRGRG